MTRPAWIGAVVVLVMLASGCGAHRSAGNPVPAGNQSQIGDWPARPRELTLDGRDPCALVPTSDWPKFYIEKPGRLKEAGFPKAPECFYSNRVGSFGVTLVTSEGIDAWRGGKRAGKPKAAAAIHGFGAISFHRPEDDFVCFVAVDVANGQYLMTSVILDMDEMSRLPELCTYAHQLAESAMSTLVAS